MNLPDTICECEIENQVIFEFFPQDIEPVAECQCPVRDDAFTPTSLEVLCYCPSPPEPDVACIPSVITTTESLILDNLLSMIHNKYCIT